LTTASLRQPAGQRRRRLDGGRTLVGGFLVFWVLAVLVPVLALLLVAFLRTRGIAVLFEPSLEAYRAILQDFRLEILMRSIRITATVTLIELCLAFPFALWLAKGLKNGWLKVATLVLLVVPFFLSPAARTIVWRSILGRQGLVNNTLLNLGLIDEPLDWLLFSEFAVHLGLIGPYFPSMVWPLFISLALIDDELIKASRDLGASDFDTLRLVILPLALPGIVAGVIFTFVPMLGDNVVAAILGGGQVSLIAEGMNDLVRVMNYAGAAAMATVVLFTIFLLQWLFWIALRRLQLGSDVFAALRQ
jgi:ABC-type spermidine/putrescine transport system permease subunit I